MPEDAAASPDEAALLAYLEDLQANDPAQYEALVQELQAKSGGVASGNQQGEQVTPTPGFVAKTRSFTRKGAKVFINVCSSDHVDKPAPVEGAESAEEVQMRIPLSLGPPREDLDKSGAVCTVYDVVFHPDAVEGALREDDFRSFMMQLTVHQIQQKHQDEVSLEMTFPKTRGNYKGIAPLPQIMRKKGVPPPPPPGSAEAAAEAADAAVADGGADGGGGSAAKKGSLVEEVAEPAREALPAPCYAVEPCKRASAPGGAAVDALAVKAHLPSVVDASAIQLDLNVSQLELLVPSVCALSLQLPTRVSLPPLDVHFETQRRLLSITLLAEPTADERRHSAGADGGAPTDAPADGADGATASEVARREREREARQNARRRRAAGKQRDEAAAAAAAEAATAAAAASGDDASDGGALAPAAEGAEPTGAKADGESAQATASEEPSVDDGKLQLTNSIMYELEE